MSNILGRIKNAKDKSLTWLDLSNNQITEIPKEIAKLKSLTWINLSNNQITSIPKEIAELKSLIGLDLSNNQITDIPKEITELKSLTILNLSNNQINSIPKEIAELKSLTRLDLSNNQINSVSKKIAELESLIGLDLSSIFIAENPYEFLVIYIPGENLNPLLIDKLISASGEFMESMGFIPEYQEEPIFASFFQKWSFKFKNSKAAKEIGDVYGMAKDYINRYKDNTSADKTAKLADATAKLIAAAAPFDEVVLRCAGLIVIKTVKGGKSYIIAETISFDLHSELEKNPNLLKNPKTLLNFLEKKENKPIENF